MQLCSATFTSSASTQHQGIVPSITNAISPRTAPGAARPRQQLVCSTASSRRAGKRKHQPQRLDPDDPVLSYYAEFANVPPEAFNPPSTIVELALDAALEREDAPDLLLDELYQARIGTAAVIQDVFKRTRARDVRLKICTTLVGEVMQEIKESAAWAELQATMQRLEAAAGPEWSWAQFERVQVYCLGSIEANAGYREMFPRPPPFGRTDIYRGWIASRALWQLAFALCLPSLLPGVQAPVCFQDPLFTVFDRRLISAMGGQVRSNDDGGWNPVEEPTFFYAPFCPHSVNERILEANYSPEKLSGLAYLGTCTTFYNELKAMWMQRIQQQQQRRQQEEQKQQQEQRRPEQQHVPGPASSSEAAGTDNAGPQNGQTPSLQQGDGAHAVASNGTVDEEDTGQDDGEDEYDSDSEEEFPDGTVHAASLAAAGVSLEAHVPSISRIHTPAVRLHIFHRVDRLEQLPSGHVEASGSSDGSHGSCSCC